MDHLTAVKQCQAHGQNRMISSSYSKSLSFSPAIIARMNLFKIEQLVLHFQQILGYSVFCSLLAENKPGLKFEERTFPLQAQIRPEMDVLKNIYITNRM